MKIFRLFKRILKGQEFYYVRILDEDGGIVATRSTGTSNERQAVRKALEILKTIPKNPLKHDPLFLTFLLGFLQRNSDYIQGKKLDGHILSNAYIDKTRLYIESLVKTYTSFGSLRLSQVSPRILDKWRSHVGHSDASRKGVNHALNGIRVCLRWAFDKGVIPDDPTRSFKYIAYSPKEKGALNKDEVAKIENPEWPDPRQKAARLLGCLCGLRRGEIRTLRWKYVDFNSHIISIKENYVDGEDQDEGRRRVHPVCARAYQNFCVNEKSLERNPFFPKLNGKLV